MTRARYFVGRGDPKVTIRFPDSQPSISNLHAELSVTDDNRYFLTDKDSTNGTEILSGNEWTRIRQTWVALDQPIRLGRKVETSVRKMLQMIDDGHSVSARVGLSVSKEDDPIAPTKRPRSPGRGAVRIDPNTGEPIVDD